MAEELFWCMLKHLDKQCPGFGGVQSSSPVSIGSPKGAGSAASLPPPITSRYSNDHRAGFLHVADSKLCSYKTMKHITDHGGRFVTVMPRSRMEDE
jgi:hypothetical protein